MNNAELKALWQSEEDFVFEGWDFSRIYGRWECPAPPWDYRLAVKTYLKDTDRLLDMGTGGGEVLLTIGHPPGLTYATEAYPPNLEFCRKKLSPLGITVVQTFADDKLPFEDEYFDFVVNRHESLDLSEVNRVLKRGGYFFTQQVGNQNSFEIMRALNGGRVSRNPAHTVDNYAEILTKMGFRIIIKDEVIYPVKFYDAGAVIFYAKACAWEVPGFSVETHFDRLRECQREIDENGFFRTTGHRFILAARKSRPDQ